MATPTSNRPLSPHLQVYRFIPTMAMSIIHRITGGAMYFGTILLAAWLVSAAMGKDAFDCVSWFFGSWLGLLILFGYTWALVHHLLGGLRHFAWDLGHGLGKEFTTKLAIALPFVSVAVTVLLWIVGLLVW
ncbi:MAG: succinate dehydrogenase, cytochrome b556 subunit [Martelella sp.]|uniref:succinate dehydrogenase, cytochrome b556 subunit n=1 Tax=Martelella sp. TaxID=1969699 RepID=UPI0032420198